MLFLSALKWNLYEKVFSCIKAKTNFCHKPRWNVERSNHSFLSNWWIAFLKHLYSLIMWQYEFEINWVCLTESYAWGIQVFYSRNEVVPHFSNRTFEYLRHNFPWDRLILRQTNNPWSSYSQDLNLPDYFLRGYLKDRVCENNPQAREYIIRR